MTKTTMMTFYGHTGSFSPSQMSQKARGENDLLFKVNLLYTVCTKVIVWVLLLLLNMSFFLPEFSSFGNTRRSKISLHPHCHKTASPNPALTNITLRVSQVLFYFQCYSVDELLEIFGLSASQSLTQQQFESLCPALVQQVNNNNGPANWKVVVSLLK